MLPAVVLASVAIAPPAFAGKPTPTKPYRTVVTPGTAPGGASQVFTVTLHNDSTSQQLGSANLSVPFTVAAASAPAPATATPAGNAVQLRNMAIPPMSSLAVSVTATIPCGAGTYVWSILAKQSNDFNGTPGNDFTLNTAGSSLATSVTTTCHLAFVTGRHPADALANAVITSVPFDVTGAAIQVAVLDGANNVVTTSTAPITLAIGSGSPSPGTTTLDGTTTTASAVAGVASFPNVKIASEGVYVLDATSPGIPSATSNSFQIWEDVTECFAGVPCTAEIGTTKSITSVVQTTSSTHGYILMSLDPVTGTCGDDDSGYAHAPAVTTVATSGITSTTQKVLTITIDKSEVLATTNNGVADYQVCYESPDAFLDRDNVETNSGLLPDCTSQDPAEPCVLSKNKDRAGNVVIQVLLPANDPKIW